MRRATDLISISPYVGRYYEGEIKGRVHEVPNAIAPRFFRVPRAPERGRLLFAGRIAKGKGPHDLVHAVARIPDKVAAGDPRRRDTGSGLRKRPACGRGAPRPRRGA